MLSGQKLRVGLGPTVLLRPSHVPTVDLRRAGQRAERVASLLPPWAESLAPPGRGRARRVGRRTAVPPHALRCRPYAPLGTAEADAVEAQWQSLRLKWQWSHAAHQLRVPGRPYPGIVPLLEAAAAQPRLRRLHPFNSHFALRFSSSTSYPWTVQAGSIEPLHNGRFKVSRRNPSAVIGEVDTAEEAVTLVLALLPTGSDPVITASEEERV
ncbi:DUF6193 family natural product biosynthesis protein [Streptomyces vinaceus]|uniref:DUF6193 family natural product biosynthesis protein n=1 Tax=Streptomyces vinaceus TaxID=1960 RepID=UPI0035D5FF00